MYTVYTHTRCDGLGHRYIGIFGWHVGGGFVAIGIGIIINKDYVDDDNMRDN